MIRIALVLLIVLLVSAPAMAQRSLTNDEVGPDTDRLWFTVTTEPEQVLQKGGWVGGEIVLDVRFVSSDPFKRLRLELPKIEGARVETLVRPHTLQINMFGGRGYSHQTRLAIVPTEAGTLTIPEIRVNGISQQRSGRAVEFDRIYPAQQIAVNGPSPTYGGNIWLVSNDVSITQSWSSDINLLSAGDTVRRTAVLDVAGVRGDDLPELLLSSNQGYRVLASDVSTETFKTDTGFHARLTQTWDLLIETDEITYIDSVHFPYWDPIVADTNVATLEQQRVEPILRDATALRDTLREEALTRHQTQRFGLIALMALPIAGLLILLALGIWHALPTRADLRLSRSVRDAGNPLNFYGAFQAWGRETFASRTHISSQDVSKLGPIATERVDELNSSLFAKDGPDANPRRTADTLIGSARRKRLSGYLSAIGPHVSRMLFLR